MSGEGVPRVEPLPLQGVMDMRTPPLRLWMDSMDTVWSPSDSPPGSAVAEDREGVTRSFAEGLKRFIEQQCSSVQIALLCELQKTQYMIESLPRSAGVLNTGSAAVSSEVAQSRIKNPVSFSPEPPRDVLSEGQILFDLEEAAPSVGGQRSIIQQDLTAAEKSRGLYQGPSSSDVPGEDSMMFGKRSATERLDDIIKTIRWWDKDAVDEERMTGVRDWQVASMKRVMHKESFGKKILRFIGIAKFVSMKPPDNVFSHFIRSTTFASLVAVAIILNVIWIGFESDYCMTTRLKDPSKNEPAWYRIVNNMFTAFFFVELAIRMLASRSWFFAGPDWAWNAFDLFLVTSSVILEVLAGVRITFVRSMRILKAIRAARVVRLLSFFTELRKMLFMMMACVFSLGWAILFISMTIFMFSVFFIQGAALALEQMHEKGEYNQDLLAQLREHYPNLIWTMFSLLTVMTGGQDWVEVHEPMAKLGHAYSIVFVVFIIFVDIFVLNVLIGVFMANAANIGDHDLIVHDQMDQLDASVSQMLNLYRDMQPDSTGIITWPDFEKYVTDHNVQAFLASQDLDTTHAQMLFSMLDKNKSNEVDMVEFVMGLIRLRGEAKNSDVRLIMYGMGCMLEVMKDFRAQTSSLKQHIEHHVEQSIGFA